MRRVVLAALLLLGPLGAQGFFTPFPTASISISSTTNTCSTAPSGRPQPLYTSLSSEDDAVDANNPPRALRWLSRSEQSIRNKLRRPFQVQNNNKKKLVTSAALLILGMLLPRQAAMAMGAMGGSSKGPIAPMERKEAITVVTLWFSLFVVLALLHAAEIAITTLYPWKVREFAEEEEKSGKKRGTFKVLNEDITRVLTTILVTSTACSIFATTIFTHMAASFFGTRGERYGAVALTALTLFFVELLPKSIGVQNAEMCARLIVPPVNLLSTIVGPLGISLTFMAKKTLQVLGLSNKDKDGGTGVSDSELRLIVTGARDSGTIDHGEQEMISGVLNLQTQRVKEIMKPRVEIVAVPKTMSVASVLGVVRESGYSRIPVYEGEIDNIVGIVLAKSVLDFFVKGVLVDDEDVQKKLTGKRDSREDADFSSEHVPIKQSNGNGQKYVRSLTGTELASRMEKSIIEADLVESCYFVPDTANGWSVLQEMRRRRVHMAIVVDEYGGTEGLVSLEDIVEEVVGEIYDEDDEEELELSEDCIMLQEDGTFLVRGDADLEDCDTILKLNLDEDEALKEFSTLSGFLCMCAGEIPNTGDFVMGRGWCFEVLHADDKRVLEVKVERLIGAFSEDSNTEEAESPMRGFLKRKQKEEKEEEFDNAIMMDTPTGSDTAGSSSTDETSAHGSGEDGGVISDLEIESEVTRSREANEDEAEHIEKMVEDTEKKRVLLDEISRNDEPSASPTGSGTNGSSSIDASSEDGSVISDSEIESEVAKSRQANKDEAEKIEKMVENTEKKQALLDETARADTPKTSK